MARCHTLIGIILYGISTVFLLSISVTSINAATIATDSARVTATVPEQSFNPPILISPSNNSITNNPRESFSWRRPSPLPATPLDHYDFYIDNELFAQGISDSLTNSQFYFYDVYRQDDIFHLNLKTDLSDGYHTWKVIAYNGSGLSAESETWSFYVDSSLPHIKLTSVDDNILNWDTAFPDSIPSVDQRYLYTSQNPLLTGTTEPNANLQFTLLCPSDVTNCQSLNEVYNYPSGSWQHRFYNLIPNKTYTVYLSTSDSAGNHIFFPPFYLIYLVEGVISPSPSITPTVITPTIPATPELPAPETPQIPPTMNEIFIPAEFIPVPPAIPTPPPIIQKELPKPQTNYLTIALLLLVFGLPLHLAMTHFGTNTSIKYTPQFLLSLLYPFLFDKKYQTIPFSTILLYDPKITYKPFQITVSDITGHFYVPKNQPQDFYIRVMAKNRYFKPLIQSSKIFNQSCLFPLLQSRENRLNRLQDISFDTRSIPLILAILTSSIALYFLPSYLLVIYLYLSLQATFSEYIYPKI